MAKAGWMSIRNLPAISHSSSYHDYLLSFFAKNSICPKCRGKGFKMADSEVIDTGSIKLAGIKAIKKLREIPNINISDVIRDILEREILDKEPCTLCKGNRFVTRKEAKRYRLSRKKRNA
jgi:DnaJ-class molecular chaperone